MDAPNPAPTTRPPAKKRRRLLRRLALVLVILVLLVAASPLALSFGFVRDFVARKVGEAIGKKVTIAKASAFWFRGVDVEGIVVESGAGFDGPLATVESVHADVDLLATIGGTPTAWVDVSRPEVTLRTDAAGRGNWEGLFPAPAEEPKEEAGDASLRLRVRGGRFAKPPAAGRPGAEIADLGLLGEVRPGGRVEASFEAVAKDAKPGGGDAPIRGQATLVEAGEGPLVLDATPLDLARLSPLLEPFGMSVTGVVTVKVDATTRPGPALDGDATVALSGFRATLADGSTVDVAKLLATAKFQATASSTRAEVSVDGDGVVAATGSGASRVRFEEPRVEVRATGTLRPTERTTLVESASATAGSSLTFRATRPLEIRTGDETRFVGAAELTADLSRLSAIVELTTGWRVAGRVTASVDAEGASADDARGELVLRVERVSASDASTAFGVEALEGTVTVQPSPMGSEAGALLTARRVSFRQRTEEGERVLDEPSVEVRGKGRRARDGTIEVDEASVAAGDALLLAATKPWRVRTEDGATTAQGSARLRADLGRLSALRAFAPQLDSLRRGVVTANLDARASDGVDLLAGVLVQDLAFGPGEWAPRGYAEEKVTAALRVTAPSKETLVVRVYEVTSRLVTWAASPDKKTFDVTTTPEGTSFAGPIDLHVDLDAASQAFEGLLALPAGERLGGRIRLSGSGAGTPADSRVDWTLSSSEIAVPPSWKAAPQGRLAGQGSLRLAKAVTEVTVKSLQGFGIRSATANVRIEEGVGAPALAQAALQVDLAGARPLIGGFLGLDPSGILAGTLDADLVVAAEGEGRRVGGQPITITDLQYRKDAKSPLLREPKVTIDPEVLLAPEGGRHRIEQLLVRSAALNADLAGTFLSGEDGSEVDLTLTLDGDDARLAAHANAFRGAEATPIEGQGRLTGKVTLRGSTAHRGRTLVVDGTVDTGRWASSGVTLERGTLGLRRPDPTKHLVADLDAGVNAGSLRATVDLDLSQEATLPWSTRLRAQAIDTSPMVVSAGPSRFLSFVLPAIVPASSKNPVLSGRLDAQVDLAARDVENPRLEDSVAGNGTVTMSQGAVKDSTIFKVLGGGGMGEVGTALAKAVPEVDALLKSLGNHLAFSRMESRFTVKDRRVVLESVRLESPQTTIQMQGWVDFEQRLDVQMSVVIGGTAGDRLAKVLPSRTIPLRVTGTLESPRTLPNITMKDLLASGLLDHLKGVDPKDPLRGLKDLLK